MPRAPRSPQPPPPRNGVRWTWLLALAGLVVALVALAWLRSGRERPAATVSSPAPAPASGPAGAASRPTDAQAFAGYAGSEACRECHPQAWEAWQNSHHALAERALRPDLDDDAFAPNARRIANLGAEPGRGPDGQARIVAAGRDGRTNAFAVGRVIGHDPLRQYLIDVGAGRWQTAAASWDPHRGEWFDVFGTEQRQPGEWGHWTGRGMTWNSQCASCHNTRVRKNYDPAADGFRTAMAEMTVGCEACHGPGRAHAEWRRAHPDPKASEPGYAKLTRAQHLDTCGSCHARRTELTGDFVPGDRFDDHFGLITVDETDTYHADGQVRDENYEFGSFVGSRMGAAGVHCLDCHQPHTGKRLLPGDALCQRCHAAGLSGAPVIVPSAHTFHRADSPGSRCENCHMPQTTYMQRHPRHDHGFTIPDPALTRELGIPNACNRCHADREVSWAEEAANQWYGKKLDRPTRARARLIAAARRGDPGARTGLLELATRTNHPPYWQAVGTRLLTPWAADPIVRPTLLGLSASTNTLVKVAALHALGGLVEAGDPLARRTMEARLTEPVRAVRLAAAGNLGPTLDPASPAGREFRDFLDFNADQPLGQLQLGSWHLARQELPTALAHFQRAIQWDPGSPPFRQQYAIALSQAGRPQDAVAQLREAVRLAPRDAQVRFQLALGLGETGALPALITELEATVRLDPGHARAWYNLGLARNQSGDPEGAVAALLEGERAAPQEADLPYARATIEARRGAVEAARGAAQRALSLRPDWNEPRELLQQLR